MPKPMKQKSPKGVERSSRPITDPRFASIQSDPRFRLPSRKHTHVQLDKRFAHMLRDDDFSKKSSVDRYGRKVPKLQGRKELQRFYRIEDEDREDDDDDDADDDDDVQRELERVGGKAYDPARDGGFSESEDDSSSSSEAEDEDEDAAEEAGLGTETQEDIPMGEVSSRIAIVNMDWDNLRAVDIMAVANSFCPSKGHILKCSIYPSEFGKERMEREEVEGPPAELFANTKGSASRRVANPPQDHASDSEGSEEEASTDQSSDEDEEKIKSELIKSSTAPQPEIDSHSLRTYQLTRLKYFYAVLVCSSPDIASTLYESMDGREYLSTANFFDMRFIPDDVDFDDDKPRDECMGVPEGYKPNEFVTEALTHSRVKLTWDEDDRTRKEAQKRAFTARQGDFDEDDLAAYVGSGSSDDEGGDEPTGAGDVPVEVQGAVVAEPRVSKTEHARRKMREALGLSDDKRRTSKASKQAVQNGNMQITFSSALLPSSKTKTSDTSKSIFENRPSDVQEETTRERYIRKERERKARRKERAKGQLHDDAHAHALEAPASAEQATTKHRNEPPQPSKPAVDAEHDRDDSADDPFADPFFTDPSAANAASRTEARRARRHERDDAAARSAAADAKQRAELELLLADDERAGGPRTAGTAFDMAAVLKAEKDAARGGKGKGKGKKHRGDGDGEGKDAPTAHERGRGGAAPGADDAFEIDVADPRFKDVYDSHEFAIDPSHARFSGTQAMNALLREGRRRRARDFDGAAAERGATAKPDGKRAAAAPTDAEVDVLLQRVKKRRT